MLTKSTLESKIFALFRIWVNKAEFAQPNLKITISDESILVNDLTKAIQNARRALFKKYKIEKKQNKGFDIGFVSGFICAQLNTSWYYDYVIKQSNEYKQFLVFKAFKIFIEFDKISDIRISAIYKDLVEEDNNLFEYNQSIEQINLQNEELNERVDKSQSEILKAINNQINKFINHYLSNGSPDYLESIDTHFSDEELTQIINDNIEK